MNWRVINASVRGSAHQRSGLPNQDAVDYGTSPRGDAPITVLAVSDGHGGGRHFRSQVGSTLAVHVAVKAVQDYLAGLAGAECDLSQLSQQIVDAWVTAVMSDLSHNPFSEAELGALEEAEGERGKESVVERPELAYGATLLVAAVTDERIIYLQLGDGDILTVAADGTTARPIAADERLVGNQTTSLCQPEAWREFRMTETATSAGLPVLVLLSTDGYVNSFRSQEDFLQIGQDYLQILREQGSDVLSDELPKILAEATQQGSGDDITLGLLHMQVLPAAPVVVNGASAGSKSKISKSVIIRQLAQERSTQEKKLTELETHYAGAQKHVLQLRLAIAAVVLLAVSLLTQQYWRPWIFGKPVKTPVVPAEPKRPPKGSPDVGKGGPAAGDPLTPPPGSGGTGDKPPAGVPGAADIECVMTLSNGSELVLADKKSVSTTDLGLDGEKKPYALVKVLSGTLFLKNLSDDKWEVTSSEGGKPSKKEYRKTDNVPLRAGTIIKFRDGALGTVSYRSKPSKDDAGTVTTAPTE
jgi:serine/threonine protein phosphatase PrpC